MTCAAPRRPRSPTRPLLPWPLQHAAERLRAGAEVRAPAVVLEAGEHARAVAREVDLDRDVADQPRAVLADGVQVDEPDARAARSSPSS